MNNKNALEDLSLIKQMITESNGSYPFKSNHFLLWGLLIPIATLTTYILDKNALFNLIPYIWLGFSLLGAILSFILGKFQKPAHKTTISTTYSMVWIGYLIASMILMFFLILNYIPLNIFLGVISLLLGLSYFVTGFLIKNVIVKIVASMWYLLAIIMFLIPNNTAGYVLGISTFFLNFLPGFTLRFRNERN